MASNRGDLLQGTLEMLVLKTLAGGPMHGYGIARRIHQITQDALRIEEGSLYPALYRMERRGWIRAKWGTSELNRRAKYYRLTPDGNKQLESEIKTWERLSKAVSAIVNPKPTGA